MNLQPFAIAFCLLTLPTLAIAQIDAPSTAVAEAELPPISLDLRDTSLRQALETMFNTINASYKIAPEVAGAVTVNINDMPFDRALELLLKTSTIPLICTKENGVYSVRARNPVAASQPNSSLRLSLELKEATIKDALAGIFKQMNKQFSLPPTIEGKVTMTIKDQPLDKVVDLILGSATAPYTYAVKNGIYEITPRRLNPATASKTVPITLKTEVVTVSGNGKRSTLLAAISRGNVGTSIRASDNTSGTPSQTSRMSVMLGTVLNGAELDVASQWEVSLPLTGTKGGIVRLDKSLFGTIRLKRGETVLVGGTVRNQYGLKDEVLFFLTWEKEK
jgi:type II secretory pathway component HofQ